MALSQCFRPATQLRYLPLLHLLPKPGAGALCLLRWLRPVLGLQLPLWLQLPLLPPLAVKVRHCQLPLRPPPPLCRSLRLHLPLRR